MYQSYWRIPVWPFWHWTHDTVPVMLQTIPVSLHGTHDTVYTCQSCCSPPISTWHTWHCVNTCQSCCRLYQYHYMAHMTLCEHIPVMLQTTYISSWHTWHCDKHMPVILQTTSISTWHTWLWTHTCHVADYQFHYMAHMTLCTHAGHVADYQYHYIHNTVCRLCVRAHWVQHTLGNSLWKMLYYNIM